MRAATECNGTAKMLRIEIVPVVSEQCSIQINWIYPFNGVRSTGRWTSARIWAAAAAAKPKSSPQQKKRINNECIANYSVLLLKYLLVIRFVCASSCCTDSAASTFLRSTLYLWPNFFVVAHSLLVLVLAVCATVFSPLAISRFAIACMRR